MYAGLDNLLTVEPQQYLSQRKTLTLPSQHTPYQIVANSNTGTAKGPYLTALCTPPPQTGNLPGKYWYNILDAHLLCTPFRKHCLHHSVATAIWCRTKHAESISMSRHRTFAYALRCAFSTRRHRIGPERKQAHTHNLLLVGLQGRDAAALNWLLMNPLLTQPDQPKALSTSMHTPRQGTDTSHTQKTHLHRREHS